MINFFKKKKFIRENKTKSLSEYFPWIDTIDDDYNFLCSQDINNRINELKSLKKYFQSNLGIENLKNLKNSLIANGYPKKAAETELNFFLEFFEEQTIQNILFNESNGFHLHKKDNQFNPKIKLEKDFGIIRTSIGKVFIVGSSNTLLPVLTSVFLSYVAGNITVVQLSSLHTNCIPDFFNQIPFDGSRYIHFTKLYRENENDLNLIEQLVSSIDWNVINLWGGNDSLSYYNNIISKNNYRPRIVNMEPLTGALLIQHDYFVKNLEKNINNLSSSISLMGQQLCSSPTIGFIISSRYENETKELIEKLINNLEKNYIPSSIDELNSIKLDRMINIARDNGSRVFTSSLYSNNICVIESENDSVFKKYDSTHLLNIHERRNFIELIKVSSFKKIKQVLNEIFYNYSYKETKKIQTILSFGDKNFDVEVHKLASVIGAYRIIDSNYVLRRHAMEAVDNFNLFSEFTNIISVVGSKTEHL